MAVVRIVLLFLLLMLVEEQATAGYLFTSRHDFPAPYGVGEVVSADINGDGLPDVITAPLAVLLNVGDTALGAPQTIIPSAGGWSLCLGDFDNDGRLDIAATGGTNKNVTLRRGNGDGTFSEWRAISDSGLPNKVIAIDLDGDGDSDLVTADQVCPCVKVFRNSGGGVFGSPQVITLSSAPVAVRGGDFDGDGIADLAVVYGVSPGMLAIFRGTGDSISPNPTSYGVADSPVSLTTGDFSGDGKADIAIVSSTASLLAVFTNLGDGTFSDPAYYATRKSPSAVISLDMNLDAALDLAVVNQTSGNLTVFLNDGQGRMIAGNDFGVGMGPTSVCRLGTNGDLVVGSHESWSVAVLRNSGPGNFVEAPVFPLAGWPTALATADFDHDGTLDLAAVNRDSNTVSLLFGDGAGTFGPSHNYATGNLASLYSASICAGDFDGDGVPDVVATSDGPPSIISVFKNDGSGGLLPPTSISVAGPGSLCLADFNRDGKPDLACAGGNSVSIVLNNGNGTFAAPVNIVVGWYPDAMVAADFDGDRDMDLVVGHDMTQLTILNNDGRGNFSKGQWILNTPVGRSMCAGDFDRDGRTDIAFAAGYSAVTFMRNSPLSGLIPAGSLDLGNGVFKLIASDLNADGMADVVVTNSIGNCVTLLEGKGDATFAKTAGYGVTGAAWKGCAGDFDRDGRVDLAFPSQDGISILKNIGPGCCKGFRGDVNGIGTTDLADLSSLVNYLTAGTFIIPCPDKANINGSGPIDLADLSALVNYLTGGAFALPSCQSLVPTSVFRSATGR